MKKYIIKHDQVVVFEARVRITTVINFQLQAKFLIDQIVYKLQRILDWYGALLHEVIYWL